MYACLAQMRYACTLCWYLSIYPSTSLTAPSPRSLSSDEVIYMQAIASQTSAVGFNPTCANLFVVENEPEIGMPIDEASLIVFGQSLLASLTIDSLLMMYIDNATLSVIKYTHRLKECSTQSQRLLRNQPQVTFTSLGHHLLKMCDTLQRHDYYIIRALLQRQCNWVLTLPLS